MTKYTEMIQNYCADAGIDVPAGFRRRPASRYAIVLIDCAPEKLVARTWFKVLDVIHYCETYIVPENGEAELSTIRILDFKDNVIMRRIKSCLKPIGPIT